MNLPTFIDSLSELKAVLEKSKVLHKQVNNAGNAILYAIQNGNKLMTCGNGGSAADALHLSEELVGRYKLKEEACHPFASMPMLLPSPVSATTMATTGFFRGR